MVGSVGAIALLTGAGIVAAVAVPPVVSGQRPGDDRRHLTIGLFITAYELMRQRLDAATLALRTKERDEAEARRLAAEAQLASIESRVQPHFLFNTLNSIAALVHDDPAGAERMTTQLSSLLRSALDSTAVPLVPLDEELRVVRAYLDIERVRFGDRLRYDVDLGDGTAAAAVPRMALQTLVENSVKYAVSPRREGGVDPRDGDRDRRARPDHGRGRWTRVRSGATAGGTRPGAARRPPRDAVRRLARRCGSTVAPGTPASRIDVPRRIRQSAIRNPQSSNPQ